MGKITPHGKLFIAKIAFDPLFSGQMLFMDKKYYVFLLFITSFMNVIRN